MTRLTKITLTFIFVLMLATACVYAQVTLSGGWSVKGFTTGGANSTIFFDDFEAGNDSNWTEFTDQQITGKFNPNSTTPLKGLKSWRISYDNPTDYDMNYYLQRSLTQDYTDLFVFETLRINSPAAGGTPYAQRKQWYFKDTVNGLCPGSQVGGNHCQDMVFVLWVNGAYSTVDKTQLFMRFSWDTVDTDCVTIQTFGTTGHNQMDNHVDYLSPDTTYNVEAQYHYGPQNTHTDSITVWLNGVDVSNNFARGGNCNAGSNCLKNIDLRPASATCNAQIYRDQEFGFQIDAYDRSMTTHQRNVTTISQTGVTVSITYPAATANPYDNGMNILISGVATSGLNQTCTNLVSVSNGSLTCTSSTSQSLSDTTGVFNIIPNETRDLDNIGWSTNYYTQP